MRTRFHQRCLDCGIFFTMLFGALFATSEDVAAQTLYAKSCVTDKNIIVRWAPASADAWNDLNKYGCVVERYTIMQGEDILSVEEIQRQKQTWRVTASPLADWEPYADDKYVAIAAECLFGESQSPAGANPFAVYQRHQERTHRYSFAMYAADMSPMAARLLGLTYTDTSIDKTAKYLYKIFIDRTDSIAADTAMTFANAKVVTPLANIPKPDAKSGNRAVRLSWDNTYLADAYTSYIVERSAMADRGFEPLTESNIISTAPEGNIQNHVYFTDSLPDNNTLYYYRVRGVDCFGRMSDPSEVVAGQGALPLAVPPTITNYQVVGNRQVVINWAFPDSVSASSVTGFRVYRQSGPTKRPRMIYEGSDPHERSYTDMLPDITNYYKLSVYNTDKEVLTQQFTYVELVDSIAPAIPVGLTGTIDTTGIVTVRWAPNTERDLAGYRVYSLNRAEGEFVLQTPAVQRDTVFRQKITLNTLTPMIYYQVRAVDVRDNTSGPSKTLALARPDTIPPVAPLFRTISTENGYPQLTWVPSSSVDVARHEVLRRKKRDADFEVLAVIDNSNTAPTYTDKTALATTDYYYAIRATDHAGNCTLSSTITVWASQQPKLEMKFKRKKNLDGLTLEWTVATTPQPIVRYIVYRADEDGDFQPEGSTTENRYDDTDISTGKKYRYAIKVVYDDDSESELIKVDK